MSRQISARSAVISTVIAFTFGRSKRIVATPGADIGHLQQVPRGHGLARCEALGARGCLAIDDHVGIDATFDPGLLGFAIVDDHGRGRCGRARVFDRLALAVAARAGLPQLEEPLVADDLAVSAAALAGLGLGPRLAAASAAGGAGHVGGQAAPVEQQDRLLLAGKRLLQALQQLA